MPDFWAQTVAIAAKNRNAAMAERDVFAIMSAACASRPRFMSITHATEVAAAQTMQMSVNRSLMPSTVVVYQKIISPTVFIAFLKSLPSDGCFLSGRRRRG